MEMLFAWYLGKCLVMLCWRILLYVPTYLERRDGRDGDEFGCVPNNRRPIHRPLPKRERPHHPLQEAQVLHTSMYYYLSSDGRVLHLGPDGMTSKLINDRGKANRAAAISQLSCWAVDESVVSCIVFHFYDISTSIQSLPKVPQLTC